jgi:hypothetical protein
MNSNRFMSCRIASRASASLTITILFLPRKQSTGLKTGHYKLRDALKRAPTTSILS